MAEIVESIFNEINLEDTWFNAQHECIEHDSKATTSFNCALLKRKEFTVEDRRGRTDNINNLLRNFKSECK